jgi:MFS family permease
VACFEEAKAAGTIVRNPFFTVLREDWRNILRIIALRVVESCAYYLTATYLLSYITKQNADQRTIALTGVVIASIIAVGTTFGAGTLTDRVGRRRVYLTGCILAIVFGIPMYMLTNTGEPFLIVLVFIIGIGIIHATLTGTQGAWFAELFNTKTRTSGASIGYQVAASIAGFAPFLAVMLANSWGWIGPALFYVFVGLVGLGGVLATAETWGPRQRAEVDAVIRGEKAAAIPR